MWQRLAFDGWQCCGVPLGVGYEMGISKPTPANASPSPGITRRVGWWRLESGRAALLLLLVFGVFWPALAGAPVFDDRIHFELDAAMRECRLVEICTRPFFFEAMGYWRPVASVSMALAFWAGGLFGVHMLALAVHAAVALVAYRLAARWFQAPRMALATATLFVVHPVQVEGVAWASAVSEPLCALFGLLAIQVALAWRASQARTWPWCMAGWLLLALGTKEAGLVVLPLVLGVAVLAPSREAVRRWLPLAAVGAIAVVTWVVLRSLVLADAVEARGDFGVGAWWSGVAQFAEMIVRQFALLIWPAPLVPLHSLSSGASPLAAFVWFAALLGIGVAGWLAWRSRIVPLRVGVVFLLVPLLLPALSQRSLGEHPIAERYLYVPTLGFALCLVSLLWRWPWLLAGAGLVWGVRSWNQCHVWRDQSAFVEHCLQAAPEQPMAHTMAGNLHLLATQGGEPARLVAAHRAFDEALRLLGERNAPLQSAQRAKVLVGLGWCELLAQQRADRVNPPALEQRFRAAIDADDSAAAGFVGLGVTQALANRHADAEAAFRTALRLDTRCPEAWFNLGCLQEEAGRMGEARESFHQALRLDPGLKAAAVRIEGIR